MHREEKDQVRGRPAQRVPPRHHVRHQGRHHILAEGEPEIYGLKVEGSICCRL